MYFGFFTETYTDKLAVVVTMTTDQRLQYRPPDQSTTTAVKVRDYSTETIEIPYTNTKLTLCRLLMNRLVTHRCVESSGEGHFLLCNLHDSFETLKIGTVGGKRTEVIKPVIVNFNNIFKK